MWKIFSRANACVLVWNENHTNIGIPTTVEKNPAMPGDLDTQKRTGLLVR
jgi:hypothetical protein